MAMLSGLIHTINSLYTGHLAIYYYHILRHRNISLNKSNALLNISLNVPARSMKGILILFEETSQPFQCDR